MLTSIDIEERPTFVKVTAARERIDAAVRVKTQALALILEAKVKSKLSGIVLNVRSGNLRRSIFSEVNDTATGVVGRVASSGDVKYAGIHEFGGTIHVPEIVPVKARALHFVAGGVDVFARRTRAHDVHMPERSFLRSTLAEMRQQIIDGLTQAAKSAAAQR